VRNYFNLFFSGHTLKINVRPANSSLRNEHISAGPNETERRGGRSVVFEFRYYLINPKTIVTNVELVRAALGAPTEDLAEDVGTVLPLMLAIPDMTHKSPFLLY